MSRQFWGIIPKGNSPLPVCVTSYIYRMSLHLYVLMAWAYTVCVVTYNMKITVETIFLQNKTAHHRHNAAYVQPATYYLSYVI